MAIIAQVLLPRRVGVLVAGAAATASATLLVPAISGAQAVAPEAVVGASTCLGQPVTIFAQPGQITNGTARGDVIGGTDGADDIRGNGGNDVICGRGGDDTVAGGAGNDDIHGGPGENVIHGDDGDDLVMVGNDGSALYGDGGDDTVIGGNGQDVLRDGDGEDRLEGGAGRDYLFSNGDSGIIDENVEGTDVLLGGAHDDWLQVFSGASGPKTLDARTAHPWAADSGSRTRSGWRGQLRMADT